MTTPAGDSERSTPTVREAVRADLLAVYRIEKASFPQPWPFAAFQRYLDEPAFLVAEIGPGVAGYVVADTVPNHGQPLGHVKDLAVHPDQRGQGVGSTLLRRALGIMRAEGVAEVKLEVREGNEVARRLYESHGFELRRTIPRYYDDGENALLLVADLTDS
ncbi:ribosomal protein S18-alanine N-acetyltransferase [Halorientalis halophila]|uniref:ribosomal protein S18-alanine N-acetyltransferase n=1 Tax=Halorientalis halophila TaxID=3108499 RepID=UPI00300AD069